MSVSWTGVDPWTRGSSGERIVLRDPDSTPIFLATIATTLGKLPRFGGHTKRFYSVAEHCMHVSLLMQDQFGDEGARVGLMHDAHEAYTGDVSTPLKLVLGKTWSEFESSWEKRVAERFSLVKIRPSVRRALHEADKVALATEMRRLMRVDDSREIEGIEPDEAWDCVGGLDAGEAFYRRAVQLGYD